MSEDGQLDTTLAETLFLPKTNHSTDNGSYSDVLQVLFSNAIHVTCLVHSVNLIGDAFKAPPAEVNSFARAFSQQCYQSGGRKYRFLNFLTKSVADNDTVTIKKKKRCQ